MDKNKITENKDNMDLKNKKAKGKNNRNVYTTDIQTKINIKIGIWKINTINGKDSKIIEDEKI